MKCNIPYDPLVCGIVVHDSTGKVAVAVGGEVYANVDKSSSDISQGDWVVPSGASGKIMRVQDDFPFKPTILGAALNAWSRDDTFQTVKILLLPGEKVELHKPRKPATKREE